jgi:hypothetical protein
MPVNRLGSATVDVEANTAAFGKGLSSKLRAALSGTEKEAKAAGKRIGRGIADSIGNELVRQAPSIRRKINAMLRGMTVTAKIKVNVDVDAEKRSMSGLAARIKGQLEGEALGPLKSSGNMLAGIFGKFTKMGKGQAAGMAAVYEGLLLTLAATADAFNAIGRELLNVVKLSAFLPAGASVLAAVVATLKVGFLGVGDAIDAVFSRDPDKLKEALKSLTPSAQSFVLEIKKALPVLDQIKAKTQESLFTPLRGVITDIVSSIGPTVSAGLSSVAKSLGSLMASIGGVLSNSSTQQFLQNLFDSTSNIITTLSGPISDLIDSLIKAANTALPSLEKLVGGSLGGTIQRLADWLSAVVEDGRFQQWLDDAKRTLSDIWYVVEQVAELFEVLFDDANLEGKSFLEIVGDMVKTFREFVESREGQLAMEGIADAGRIAGAVLIGVLTTVVLITAAIGSLIAAIRKALTWLGILEEKKRSATAVKGLLSSVNLPGYAEGDIVKTPQVARLAESGREVVIPLTKPGRARELAEKSGLTRMLGGEGGGTTQVFYLGEQQVTARMVEIVDSSISRAVGDASYGVRVAS